MGFLNDLKRGLGIGGAHTKGHQRKHGEPYKSNVERRGTKAGRAVGTAPAAPGTWAKDRKPSPGARAQVNARSVHNGTDPKTGRRHHPVQNAADQYSAWWGHR